MTGPGRGSRWRRRQADDRRYDRAWRLGFAAGMRAADRDRQAVDEFLHDLDDGGRA